ncbi:MAG: helix-turn-helix domain-containing protein [Gallionella sp.]|nr:helix-turn-helix domain-containing protein [Gallionella sp.]
MKPTQYLPLLCYSLTGAAAATSLSESTIDAAIRAGILPVRRHGNRTLILARDLERWLNSLPTVRPNAPPQLEGRRTGRPRKVISCVLSGAQS